MDMTTTTVQRMRCPNCKIARPLPTTPLQPVFPVLQRSATDLTLWWNFRPRGQFEVEPRFIRCETCDRQMRLFVIEARESTTECGDKCQSATGPACECKCKGENHGGGNF